MATKICRPSSMSPSTAMPARIRIGKSAYCLEEFASIQRLAITTKSLLWVVYQTPDAGTNATVATALKGMVNGFARASCNESSSIELASLDIRGPIDGDTANARFQVVCQQLANIAVSKLWGPVDGLVQDDFNYVTGTRSADYDCENTDIVMISCLVVDCRFNSWISSTCTDSDTTVNQLYHDIRPHASGVKSKDISIAMGQAPPGTPGPASMPA
ncbi:hypothetical protein Micbo1qcDRAFT_209645 [Microdochium bolleyi]|uniref:Uncharacterized protein n=1 Tax=Microdochium bolleyi TaxID=196109 RepID=A0A136ILH1_9PEZI|nr:hypothetical protein Micbo1qcDRAFT_209645 [Microdochium bolleyi]